MVLVPCCSLKTLYLFPNKLCREMSQSAAIHLSDIIAALIGADLTCMFHGFGLGLAVKLDVKQIETFREALDQGICVGKAQTFTAKASKGCRCVA